MAARLTHADAAGRARMVDVSAKPDTRRVAEAEGAIRLKPETLALIRENALAKGDVLATARLAGIMAAKRTADLIPLCHPLLLHDVQVDLTPGADRVTVSARVVTTGKTGAEMEALAAVSVAALTVFDMCKAVDREMVIEGVRVTHKEGGRSDWGAERETP